MQRNSLNQIFKTLRHQEQMILSSNMYEKIYLKVYLKEFLKLFKCLASSSLRMVGSPLQSSSQREKEKKGENSHKACMCTLSCGRSPPIYRHLV